MFQDEARFGRINDPRRCWAPRGFRPEVGMQIVREYTYAFGAVSPHDGALDTLVLPVVTAEAMSIFLAEVARPARTGPKPRRQGVPGPTLFPGRWGDAPHKVGRMTRNPGFGKPDREGGELVKVFIIPVILAILIDSRIYSCLL